ncbi:trypsin-4-like [Zophobas morio]|uniref:trypsin-4-like n=1 Tax=Zophobas morio TaxID=2755281 RepID=UPI003083224A
MHTQCFLLLSTITLPILHTLGSRIIGGSKIPITATPYQLILLRARVHICGAVLIAPQRALSAAHCFPAPGPYSVKGGVTNLQEPGFVSHINMALIHPNFTRTNGDYDLSVLFLATPFPLSDKIRPVALPREGPEGEIRAGMVGKVSGWGKTTHNSDELRSEDLKGVDLPVVAQEKCQKKFDYFQVITERKFCAGVEKGGEDACTGDSGGPFVVEGVLYGIVSDGLDCAQPGWPGIYTNVQVLRGFIRENAEV